MKRCTYLAALIGVGLGSAFVSGEPQPATPSPFGAPSAPVRSEVDVQPIEKASASDQSEEDDSSVTEPSRTAAKPLGPNFITLRLLDGNVISGDLSVDEITVATQFGDLVVPVAKIVSLTPGLDAYPKLAAEIDQLVSDLGSDDYKTREQAHKALVAQGLKVRNELERFAHHENAEVKRHVGEILKEFEELAEEQDDAEDEPVEQPWIRLDTVVTTEFTIIGKISPSEFRVASKYGPLTVALADVKQGERKQNAKESLRKNLTLTGQNLAQRQFKSSGIRVQAGDRISVWAEGTLTMSPWGNNSVSTPDGAQNYGWYIPGQIPGGTLVARIGDQGTVFKVGRQATIAAKSSGVLQFAIGMQGEYANEGYQFPGEYRLRLKVDPK